MLQANELRIGNHVLVADDISDNNLLRDHEISGLDLYCMVSEDVGKCYWMHGKPLTEEFLLRSGFKVGKCSHAGDWKIYRRNNLDFIFYCNDFYFYLREEKIKIDFFHQVQNLFFSTYFKELVNEPIVST